MFSGRPSRRKLIVWSGGLALCAAAGPGFAVQVVKDIADLLPGEFTWHPERSPDGPVAVIVSIPQQRVHVYRNGVRMAVSTCSTGKPGHSTPTGIFTVLQKDKHHRSSTYNNAPMPNMNRLTWSGVALHAGNLPGYPASHGCVRLPLDFSEKLFGITHVGTPVIIAGAHGDPWELTHPGLVLGDYAENEFAGVVSGLNGKSHPADWTQSSGSPVTTVIISTTDASAVLLENSEEVAKGKATIKGPKDLGEHVFMLQGAHEGSKGMSWHAITHHPDPGQPLKPGDFVISRISTEKAFAEAMRSRMHPGMVLIVTAIPSHPDRRSGSDFVVMDATS